MQCRLIRAGRLVTKSTGTGCEYLIFALNFLPPSERAVQCNKLLMMASVMKTDKGRPPTAGSVAYATASETLKIPQTPLESRQGYHPKSVSS